MEENTNNEVKKAHISVLLPTRGRQEVLKDSITGLIEKASNHSEVEILFGVDEDDQGVIEYIKNDLKPLFDKHKVEARASVFKPLGYDNLHVSFKKGENILLCDVLESSNNMLQKKLLCCLITPYAPAILHLHCSLKK